MTIEPLESRIAPASLTFTDIDGDKVVITTTGAGTLTLGGNVIVTPLPGAQTQVVTLDLTNPAFQGANVSIVATRDPDTGGDGLVNIGNIDAGGRDLGKVLVDGDLGQLFAGSGTDPTRGVTSLEVASLGGFGTTTGAPGLAVNVDGKVGALKVKGDVRDTLISAASFGAITIGGSLFGGEGADSGTIRTPAGGAIGPVKIGGSIEGGSELGTGSISAGGTLASVTIGGSLLGGTQVSTGSISSMGAMGSVKIGGNIEGGGSLGIASGRISTVSTLASLTVIGSIIGTNQNSAEIFTGGAMGPVKIGGNLQGGNGSNSALINAGGPLASITIGGSMIGQGTGSGSISSTGTIGAVKIRGNVEGGPRSFSGCFVADAIASVTIGGSLIGGTSTAADQTQTGSIFASGKIGPVKIGGNLQGGSTSAAVTLFDSGAVIGRRIASLTVGGSIIAGDSGGGGTLVRGASIQAGDDLGAVTVKGSLIGKPGATVLILARGQAVPGATSDLAIKSLTVGGRVERADILAGYTRPPGTTAAEPPTGVNADAQIGAVVVGDWFTSNLAAGVQDNATPERNDFFGEGDDQAIAGGSATIVSKIASITIKGYAFGTVRVNQGTGIDHFGFVAQQIGSFKAGDTVFPLAAGAGSDLAGLFVGATSDLRVREVAI